MWRGDYPEDFATVTIPFTTHSSTGAPVAPSTAFETADFKIYKNGNQAEKTTTNGLTIQSPHDSITGGHTLIIDTSNDTGDGGFWVAGAVYDVWLTPDETVDSVAVAKVVGTFGIDLAGTLRPTTAGRKLDVTATGAAGIDWGNVENLTTANDLSGTNIKTDQKVDLNTIKTQAVTAASGVTVLASVGTAATSTAQTGDAYGRIGANGAGLSAVPWNAAWDAEVQSEVEDALVVHRLDELLNADSDIDGAAPPTVGSVFHELMTKTAGSFTYDQTTDSMEAIRDRGDAAWITATGFSTHSAADVWAVGTRLLTAGTNIVLAKGVGVTGFNDIAAGAAMTLTAAYDAAKTAAQASDIPTGDITAILADTNELQTDWTNGGRLDLLLDGVVTQANLIPGTTDGLTFDEKQTLFAAVLLGKASGLDTTTAIYRAADDSKDRVTATVDDDGNRSAVTLDPA